MSDIKWGIDLGGTKVECAVLDSSSKPIVRQRIETEAAKGYHHILSQIKKVVDIVADQTGFRPSKIGMCTPGSIEKSTGLLKNSNTVVLNEKPFLKDIQSILQIPVGISNDANCFAIAEANMGIVQDVKPEANVVFGVIMGSGVGGGVVVDGKIINGLHGIGGEWGHNFLDESGGTCYCGKVGCVEKVISGKSLEAYYEKQSGSIKKLKEIVQLARMEKDVVATQTLKRLIHMFGKAISVIINILDPDVIVIGGGVGNVDELYTDGILAAEKHMFNASLNTIITKPKLGDSAGVFGAALLV